MNRISLYALGATAMIATAACTPAQAGPIDTSDKEAIEQIVHDYILENPEIIEQALITLTERQRAAAAESERKMITQKQSELYNQEGDYFIGPADAKVTVVEFFDYRCGYCRRSLHWVTKLPEDFNNQVRVVYKELPIFGGISETASLAALAAGRQGKYPEMHRTMMGLKNNKDLTEAKIDAIARDLGVDVEKMHADMRSTSVRKQLSDSKMLADQLGVEGTPAFFIGGKAIKGADEDGLKTSIAEALKN